MVSVTLEGLWMISDRIVDFRFLSNFTGPDRQKFSCFELSQRMLVMHHKSSLSSKRTHQHGVCYSGRIMDGF